jgi:hypothetical protein
MRNNFQFAARVFFASVLFFSFSAFGQKQSDSKPVPLSPSEALAQGKALAQETLSRRPTQNVTNIGVLKIRDARGKRYEIPVTFKILVTPGGWQSVYTFTTNSDHSTTTVSLRIRHPNDEPTESIEFGSNQVSNRTSTTPFAGSDFWICDLGLEFLHWPQQKLLRSELRNGRSSKILESVNPQPATNGYSRVVSRIDAETGGIVHAEAYDSRNELLKEFDAKKFKKVNGEYQLEEMEMSNVQRDSRSQIEFDLESK